VKQASPYIRSILAFLFRMRYTMWDHTHCYKEADKFIAQLKEDIET